VCIILSELLSIFIKIEDCEAGCLICRVVLHLRRSGVYDNGAEKDISTYYGDSDKKLKRPIMSFIIQTLCNFSLGTLNQGV